MEIPQKMANDIRKRMRCEYDYSDESDISDDNTPTKLTKVGRFVNSKNYKDSLGKVKDYVLNGSNNGEKDFMIIAADLDRVSPTISLSFLISRIEKFFFQAVISENDYYMTAALGISKPLNYLLSNKIKFTELVKDLFNMDMSFNRIRHIERDNYFIEEYNDSRFFLEGRDRGHYVNFMQIHCYKYTPIKSLLTTTILKSERNINVCNRGLHIRLCYRPEEVIEMRSCRNTIFGNLEYNYKILPACTTSIRQDITNMRIFILPREVLAYMSQFIPQEEIQILFEQCKFCCDHLLIAKILGKYENYVVFF